MIRVTIHENDAGQRLDRFLRKYLQNAPLGMIYKIIRRDLKINGKRAEQKTILAEGDELSLYITEDQLENYTEKKSIQPAARRSFRIIYEDAGLLIVNKPAGLLTHGDAREKKNTLVNQVTDYLIRKKEYTPGKEKTFSPAAVNRLDRNTSGMVVFGKNAESLRALSAMFRDRKSIEKHYLTVVRGEFRDHAVLTGRVEKDEQNNKLVVYREEHVTGRIAETEVTPLAFAQGMTLLDVHLITGRTHQIRAHLAAEGFPVAGDVKYGDRRLNQKLLNEFGLKSQFLHAYRLEFRNVPDSLSSVQSRCFIDPLPSYLDHMAGRLFGSAWKAVYRTAGSASLWNKSL